MSIRQPAFQIKVLLLLDPVEDQAIGSYGTASSYVTEGGVVLIIKAFEMSNQRMHCNICSSCCQGFYLHSQACHTNEQMAT